MNIQIKHISNTFNYGSCMMAITLIDRIKKDFEDANIYVDCSKMIDLERLIEETECRKNLIRENKFENINVVTRVINKIRKLYFKYKSDVVIIIGGDDISEYYGTYALEKELKRIETLSYKKSVILLGQTMGPFTGKRCELARESLKKTTIYTRDDKCFNYLNKIGFKNIIKGRDLAFLDLPRQAKSKSIMEKYNLEENRYITMVPSGLTKCYTTDYNIYVYNQVEIIKNLVKNQKLAGKKLVLLPHVLLPDHVDDRLVINDILKNIDENIKSKIIYIEDAILPSEAREILSNGIFTITGRMHAAVSSFYMRKPAISLSYSVKYAGVISDGLGMGKLVIESANDNLWKKGTISNLVNDKVNYILDNYENLINEIDENVIATSEVVEKQLADLVKKIKKHS